LATSVYTLEGTETSAETLAKALTDPPDEEVQLTPDITNVGRSST